VVVIFGLQINEWLDREIITIKVDDDEGCKALVNKFLKFHHKTLMKLYPQKEPVLVLNLVFN